MLTCFSKVYSLVPVPTCFIQSVHLAFHLEFSQWQIASRHESSLHCSNKNKAKLYHRYYKPYNIQNKQKIYSLPRFALALQYPTGYTPVYTKKSSKLFIVCKTRVKGIVESATLLSRPSLYHSRLIEYKCCKYVD